MHAKSRQSFTRVEIDGKVRYNYSLRSPLPSFTPEGWIEDLVPVPKVVDDATAFRLLQRASDVSREVNASKAVLVLTSAIAAVTILLGGPVYGAIAAIPALLSALSLRVVKSLSRTAKELSKS
jgi:hypothetical protein